MNSQSYRPEIDGLRSLAIIPVILFHLDYPIFKGGYLGVDLFFVISGYLITRMISNSLKAGHFSFWEFWLRRIKRLLPLLLLVVLSSLLMAQLLLFKPEVKNLCDDVLPAIFSYFNFHAWLNFGSYWGRTADASFFLHTWSLSIEEQFYLLYPFMLWFGFKRFKKASRLLAILTFLSLGYFLAEIYYFQQHERAFYLLPARLWELSAGGLAALASPPRLKKSYAHFGLSLGLIMVLSNYFLASPTISFHALITVAGTLLIIWFGDSKAGLGRCLSHPLLVYIGKLSYSLYLWHWVLISFRKSLAFQLQHFDPLVLDLGLILGSLLLSLLSYHLVENKTRYYRHSPKLVLAGLALVIGLGSYFSSKYYDSAYPSPFRSYTSYLRLHDNGANRAVLEEFIAKNKIGNGIDIPHRPKHYDLAYRQEGIRMDSLAKDPEIILLGDSHGVMWAKVLGEVAEELDLGLANYAANGSKPFFDPYQISELNENLIFKQEERQAQARAILKHIDLWRVKLVIIVSRWQHHGAHHQKRFEQTLSYLSEKGIRVLAISQPPLISFMGNKNPHQFFAYLSLQPRAKAHLKLALGDQEPVFQGHRYLQELSQKHPSLTVFPAHQFFREGDSLRLSYGDQLYYQDDDHLSYYGTLALKEELKSVVDSLNSAR